MSSGKEQQCITTSKTRTIPPKNGTRTLNDSFGRSGQATHSQEAHRRRGGSGSKGKVLAKLGPIATAIAGEQDREALRLEGFQIRLGTTDCADWLTMIENENGWSVIVVEFVCIWNYGVQIVIAAGKLGDHQGPIVIIGNHVAPFRNGFASFTRMFKTADNFG